MGVQGDIPGLRIGEVARRTGMSTAALRAWETRYGLLTPARTTGGQRLYSEGDVERVRLVKHLVAQGWSIPGAVARVREGRDPADDASEPDGDDDGPPRREAGTAPGAASRSGLLAPLADVDPEAVLAAYETARAMLRAAAPSELSEALVALVERLGGRVGPAAEQDDEVLPIDVSLGEGSPLLPRAAPATLARMRLEAVLPHLVEDGRAFAHRLRLSRRRTMDPV